MRIVLFCENQYAIDILNPIQIEADREGNNEVLWYVHEKKIRFAQQRVYRKPLTSCLRLFLCLETLFLITFRA